MMPRIFTQLLLLLLAVFLTATPAAASSPTVLSEVDYMFGNPDTGMLYGPPLAAVTPDKFKPAALMSRGLETKQLKQALRYVPDTLTYKVKPGDSLYDIAHAFGTDIHKLVAMNHISNPSFLQIGQALQVPNRAKEVVDTNLIIDNVLTATLTAYTAGPESTGKSPGHPAYGVTASGRYVQDRHTIAVDPRMIPLGTKVYIEGLGVRVAEDTGGAIQGNRIDVYMSDLSAAIQFGVKRNVKVYVLKDNEVSA